jgi:hypothetical protein
MKKFVLLTIVAYLFSIVHVLAQTEKGKLFFTGAASLDFDSGKEKSKTHDATTDNYTYMEFKFYDKAGYTVINNLPVGIFLDVDLYSDKDKTGSYTKYTSTDFSIGPFVRYYIVNLNGLKPYAEGLVGFGIDNEKETYPDGSPYKNNETFFTYRVGAGATYFMNDILGFDMFLGFDHKNYTHKENTSGDRSAAWDYKDIYNEFVLSLGIVIMLE